MTATASGTDPSATTKLRFRLGGVIYHAAALGGVTLRQALAFERDCDDLGVPMTWPQAQAAAQELFADAEALSRSGSPADVVAHPRFLLTIAMIVWAGRLAAGEDISWADALEVNLEDIDFLETPADRKSPDPRRARPGASGRAGAQATKSVVSKTSGKRSTPA